MARAQPGQRGRVAQRLDWRIDRRAASTRHMPKRPVPPTRDEQQQHVAMAPSMRVRIGIALERRFWIMDVSDDMVSGASGARGADVEDQRDAAVAHDGGARDVVARGGSWPRGSSPRPAAGRAARRPAARRGRPSASTTTMIAAGRARGSTRGTSNTCSRSTTGMYSSRTSTTRPRAADGLDRAGLRPGTTRPPRTAAGCSTRRRRRRSCRP